MAVLVLAGCERAHPAPAAQAEPSSALSAPTVAHPAPAPSAPSSSAPRLCFTLGAATAAEGGRMRIDAAKTRAVSDAWNADRAEIAFRYRGPTDEATALGSGAVRRQLGLKLRAENGCNLVYAMWRMEPKNEIVVSVKRNVGQRTHAECKNRGYVNVKPDTRATTLPTVRASNEEHTLGAEIVDGVLVVRADGAIVWKGALPEDARALRGPGGIRTDNVKLDVSSVPQMIPTTCRGEGADEEE
jgi:hypothetical protein